MMKQISGHTRTGLLALGLALAFAGGCDDKKGDDAKKADAKDGKDAKGAEDVKAGGDGEADGGGAAGAIELAKIGLVAEGPAGASVGDAIGGEGVMVQAPGLVVTVEPAKDTTPADEAKAKEEADMYSPENWKAEKLDDGFAVTFENKGGMGTNYWVQVRREIDGKGWWCTTTAAEAEQQANALAFCKSLKTK